MNELSAYHRSLGARLAADGIPLDYGDLAAEYAAADGAAVLLDRSHEGRILVSGADRLNLVNRMSTNELASLAVHDGRATIFTNANARILFRAECFQRPEGLLLISEPGQGQTLADFLRRNVFFGDKAVVSDHSAATAQFALHGARADEMVSALAGDRGRLPGLGSADIGVSDHVVALARRKPVCGGHWAFICPAADAAAIHQRLLEAGRAFGLQPAGSLLYNILRIRSGRPGRAELSTDYLPLEVGLWDEVSFSKGCYTGQEIIARMESRERLAKALVQVELSRYLPAPADLYSDGRAVGRLTSSVEAPDGQLFALAVVRLTHCKADAALDVERGGAQARVKAYAGVPPPYVMQLTQQT